MDARVGGADFLQLSPASAPSRGLTSWLADAVRAMIRVAADDPGDVLDRLRRDREQ